MDAGGIVGRPRRRRTRAVAAGLLAAAVAGAAALMTGGASTARDSDAAGGPETAETPEVVAEEQAGGRLVDLTVRSPALGDEPATVRLLTPDGWEQRQGDQDWPVLWLLPGGDGDYQAWTDDSDIEELPELRDTLVVMPEMPMFGFYTDWHNGGEGGPPAVETFHLDELRPLLERDYGAGDRRVIAGLSQGGYGAVAYAAHHPGMFAAAASYSGWLHPLQHAEIVMAAAEFVGVEDGTAIWGDPVADRDVWEAGAPYFLADQLTDTPVYLASGDGTPGPLDPPDLEREELFPAIDQHGEQLPEDVVDVTEEVMGTSTRTVAERFVDAGVRVTTHLYPGTHSPAYWERELHHSLPMLLKALHGHEAGR